MSDTITFGVNYRLLLEDMNLTAPDVYLTNIGGKEFFIKEIPDSVILTKKELKKRDKEIQSIKEYIKNIRSEALKNNGENFALLQFIQRLEEAFTWVREL